MAYCNAHSFYHVDCADCANVEADIFGHHITTAKQAVGSFVFVNSLGVDNPFTKLMLERASNKAAIAALPSLSARK